MKKYPYLQIYDIADLPAPEDGTNLIGHYAFLYVDFREAAEYAMSHRFVDCIFFGCEFLPGMNRMMRDCLVLPRMGMVFSVFHPDLYNAATLYEGFNPTDEASVGRSYDARVYKDYQEAGDYPDDIRVTLARSQHDHSMYDAMVGMLHRYDPHETYGIMGGHGLKRSDPMFAKIARISKTLTEKGYLMLSGGGPGAMEATHVGAWMAGRSESEFQQALDLLVEAGEETTWDWLRSAFEVMERFPQRHFESLAIPTWFYGHEPATPFATHIAKFFMNSVREDMILASAEGGIIFAPGSAGTVQEIFQDASKLHYDKDGNVGQMIFLDRDFYIDQVPVYPFLTDLSHRGRYRNLHLSVTDSVAEVISLVTGFSKRRDEV